jgi:diguanylate cyclase (GGDEF)-like protein
MRWRSRRRGGNEADRTASEADQTAADADQTASDTDQSASDRDQALSEADQRSSDQVASERDEAAARRDETARERDRIADQRDRAAGELNHEAERLAQELGKADARTAAALEAATIARGRAAADRARAAADRERAGRDREAAARDRELHRAELERAELDELTGAYRRRLGEVALGNEVERARRSGRDLVLVYIDVDALKEVNDRDGHAAGDELLRNVVASLRSKVRPYDPLVRWGGDEFICAISETELEDVSSRVAEVRELLAETHPGASITVGLAALRPGDTLEALISRADAELLATKRRG